MENEKSVIGAYNKLLKMAEKSKMSIDREYECLLSQFEKASYGNFEEHSKEAYFFQAIVKRLSELTLLKATN